MSASSDTSDEKSVKSGGEAVASTKKDSLKPLTLPFTNFELPYSIAFWAHRINDKMQQARNYALKVTPAPIINYNSNINGLLHVAAEIAMFKASGVKFLKAAPGKKVNYLTDPPRNLYRAITGADKEKELQNHWSSRATMGGFGSWVLGTIEPDKLNNEHEVRDAERLSKDAPIKYAASKLYESIQIFNPDTKRQQIGLGVTIAGGLSAIAGFYNVDQITKLRFWNKSQTAGAVITALAGAQLMFATSDKKGWEHFGNLINFRIPLLTMSIIKKHNKNDRWGMYALGQGLFQGAAIYSYLYGGAQKLPDGKVIEEISEATQNIPKHGKAFRNYKGETEELPDNALPENKVIENKVSSLAMPERRAEAAVQEVA